MAWIKYTTTLHDSPRVVRMSDALECDVYAITGRLMKLWTWASDHTSDGNAVGVSKSFVDRYVGFPGFADAMIVVGWLVQTSGGIVFPEWDKHLSNGAKSRAIDSERKKVSRFCPDSNRTELGLDKRREDKRRTKDKKTEAAPPRSDSVSLPFDSPEFKAAWANWLAYRTERRLAKLAPSSVTAQLAKFAAWGEAASIASIAASIANGWQGLFEPKEKAHAHRPVNQERREAKLAGEFAAHVEPPTLCFESVAGGGDDSLPVQLPRAARPEAG